MVEEKTLEFYAKHTTAYTNLSDMKRHLPSRWSTTHFRLEIWENNISYCEIILWPLIICNYFAKNRMKIDRWLKIKIALATNLCFSTAGCKRKDFWCTCRKLAWHSTTPIRANVVSTETKGCVANWHMGNWGWDTVKCFWIFAQFYIYLFSGIVE